MDKACSNKWDPIANDEDDSNFSGELLTCKRELVNPTCSDESQKCKNRVVIVNSSGSHVSVHVTHIGAIHCGKGCTDYAEECYNDDPLEFAACWNVIDDRDYSLNLAHYCIQAEHEPSSEKTT